MIAVVIFKLGGAYLYRKDFLKIKAGERERGRLNGRERIIDVEGI